MLDLDSLSDVSSLTSVPDSPQSSALSSPPNSPVTPPGLRNLTPPPSQHADEDMPPARKRRKVEPRIRTTQHLDLTSDTAQSEYDRREALETLTKALRNRRKIVVIAGAGISVSAGIPDFRSSHGLFRSLRRDHKLKGSGKELFDASVYKDDSSTSHFHDMVRKLAAMAENAKPTRFHHFLARLATEGRLLRLYTQNVDGLETSLEPLATQIPLNHKAPFPQTIQLHGGLEKMVCQKCRHISDFQADLFNGPLPPPCPVCIDADALRTTQAGKRSHGVGRLRPRMVLYNEHNPDDEAIGAVTTADFRTRPDAVVVVGTSMKIPAVRRIAHEMCKIVRDRREGTTIWINLDPVPPGKDLENCWDLVVKGDCDQVAELVDANEWDNHLSHLMEGYTDSDVERVKSSQEIKVVIPPTPKKTELLDLNPLVSTMTPPRSQSDGLSPVPVPKAKNPSPLKRITLTLKNPASTNSRKLSDVLGKTNKTKANSKTSLNRKPKLKISKPISKQSQISGKVSKSLVKPIDISAAKKLPGTFTAYGNTSTVPSLDNSSTEVSPGPETPSSIPDTISPKGNVPVDMLRLLN